MNCAPDLIEAYLDNELDASERAALERHLAECADCAGRYARLRSQKEDVKQAAGYYKAPAELQESIRRGLRREAGEGKRVATAPWRPLAIAASLLLVVSASWNAVQMRTRATQAELPDSVLNDHLRSLIGTHLLDVPSSDQHTVKPWFAGKLDFSPDVRDLTDQGFPLAGGRLEYLQGRRVAALVYHRRQHVINLFIWPISSSSSDESAISRNGYNLRHWTSGMMTYWAVSDVSAPELDTLRNLYR